jgi:hypothetical protein
MCHLLMAKLNRLLGLWLSEPSFDLFQLNALLSDFVGCFYAYCVRYIDGVVLFVDYAVLSVYCTHLGVF